MIYSVRSVLARLWRINAPLTLAGLAMLATLVVASGGLIVDPRQITGAPAWMKPAKFAVSLGIYAFTLVWMVGHLRGRLRVLGRLAASVTAVAVLVEEAIITVQVVRGVASHFNNTTALDSSLFGVMGLTIMVLASATLLVIVLLAFQRLDARPFAWSLRLGLLLTFAGMLVATLMVEPTPAQREQLRAGVAPPAIGAHAVGVPDGGPGLPIVGWSTEGGDLRVPHFLGLHAMQALPLVGWLLSRRRAGHGAGQHGGLGADRPTWRPDLGEGRRVALVAVTAASYLGLVGLTTWQALRGQSVVAPDAPTLLAFAALAATTALAVAAILHGWNPRPTADARAWAPPAGAAPAQT